MHKPRSMSRLITLVTLLTLLFTAPLFALEDDEYLKPDEAFRFAVTAKKEGAIQATWQVAKDYYLYEKRFKFKSETEGVTLGTPLFPKGKMKNDPNFGNMMIHRNEVRITIPYTRTGTAGNTLDLKLGYQGCADLGLCYAPQTKKVSLQLPPPKSTPPLGAATPSAALSSLTDLGKSLGLNDMDDIPTSEQAYQFSADQSTPGSILLKWAILPGTYLYQDGIKVRLTDGTQAKLGDIQLPKAVIKKNALRPDGSTGDLPVYYEQLQFVVPITWLTEGSGGATLKIRYQGCADAGVCYPPVNKEISLQRPGDQQIANANTTKPPEVRVTEVAAGTPPAAPQSDLEEVDSVLTSGNTYLIIAFFFGLGLLLAFTPCVFPMIPILSGIIAGQGSDITTKKAFTLSLVYVLSMALTYTAAGVLVAGVFGDNINLQATFQNPWILGTFAIIFVLLALSMFGFYELQLPSSWQTKLTETSNKQKSGSLVVISLP